MTLKSELKQMEKYVVRVEKDDSLTSIRELMSPKSIAGCIIDKLEHTSKRYRPYNILDIAFIGDLFGESEEEIQQDIKINGSKYEPAESVKQIALVEKYIICKMIIYFSKENPEQLAYCGDHLFLLKSLHILVEMFENSVILHKYY